MTKTAKVKTTVAKKAPVAVAKVSKTKKTAKPTPVKKTSTIKTQKAKTTTKVKAKTAPKTSSKKNVVTSFLTNMVKEATKVQKSSQSQTKAYIKQLNTQDKELAQLSKKLMAAKGKSKQTLDNKIAKLQGQMSTTRSDLLASENNTDKIATLIEWTNKLSSASNVTAYMQPKSPATTTKTVKNTKTAKTTPVKSAPNKSTATTASDEDDTYAEETEDLDFDFGDSDDLDESARR